MNVNFRKIVYYSAASTNDAAFVIGGSASEGSYLDVIAQFRNDEWSLYGNLHKRRYLHGSITFGSQTMVIGGFTNAGS